MYSPLEHCHQGKKEGVKRHGIPNFIFWGKDKNIPDFLNQVGGKFTLLGKHGRILERF